MAEKKTVAKKEVKETKPKAVKKAEPKKGEVKKEVKKAVAKKTSPKKVAVKKEEIKEEIKPVEVKEEKKIEEIKPVEIKEEEEEKACKNNECFFKKNKALLLIILAVIVVIGLLFYFGNNKNTYPLNETNETYTGEMSVTLPSKWYASKDNQLYVKDGKYLDFKGAIYAEDLDEEYYNEMIAYYSEYYELEEVTFDTLNGYLLNVSEGEYNYSYYFLKNDVASINVIFINADETTASSIINTIK